MCPACAGEYIATVLTSNTDTRLVREIAASLSFNRCGHQPNGEMCWACYLGVISYLNMLWSHARLAGDTTTANRLRNLLTFVAQANGVYQAYKTKL